MFMPINLIILAKHYVIRCNVIRSLLRLSVCDACELSLSGGFFQNLIIAPEISEMIRRDRTSYTVVSVYLRVPCRFVHCGVATTAMVGLLYGWTNKPCHTCTVMISGSPMTTSTVSLTRQEQLASWLISVRTCVSALGVSHVMRSINVRYLLTYLHQIDQLQQHDDLTLQWAQVITVPHRIIGSWYTGHWWVGCYIWYSEEGLGWAFALLVSWYPVVLMCCKWRSLPRPLLAVPNVTQGSPPINGLYTSHRIAVYCSVVLMCPLKD